MKTYSQFSEGLKDYSNQGKNVRVPGEDTASFSKLFKDDLKQTGKFKNPTTGKLEGGIFPNLKKGYQVYKSYQKAIKSKKSSLSLKVKIRKS